MFFSLYTPSGTNTMDKLNLLDLLTEILGSPSESHSQSDPASHAFNCPVCAKENGGVPDDKYNLETNLEKNVYHCWVCGDSHGTRGRLSNLVYQLGSRDQKNRYKTITKNYISYYKRKNYYFRDIDDSETFDYNSNNNPYLNYLRYSRNLPDKIIKKYDIGYIDEGYYKGNIYIPSKDRNGLSNGYVLRTIDNTKRRKYTQKMKDKGSVFFEDKVLWYDTIYLTEGVFDAIVTPNGLPLLGKHASDTRLYNIAQQAKSSIVLILDRDTSFEKDYVPILSKLSILTKNDLYWIKPQRMGDLSDIFSYGGYTAVGRFIKNQIKKYDDIY